MEKQMVFSSITAEVRFYIMQYVAQEEREYERKELVDLVYQKIPLYSLLLRHPMQSTDTSSMWMAVSLLTSANSPNRARAKGKQATA